MAITDQQYTNWLDEQDALRCILAEVVVNVSGVETTRYLSTKPYVTESADTPSNTAYLSIISGGVKFTESIDIDSAASLNFGDIEIDNSSWLYDGWLDDVWVNREIKVYLGDATWERADFRTIFDGIVDNLDSKSHDVLNISIRDKLQRLNTPVTEVLLGGSTVNQDKLLPVLFGECFNITPLLVDEATLEYQVHNGVIEDIFEVRDNGVPVSFTKDLVNGKFTLTQNPAGTITCSAQGYNTGGYTNTVADIVQILAISYGKASEQFALSDIDTVNFAEFEVDNQQPVGLYLTSRTNVLTAINNLTQSLGAQAVMTRSGLLRIVKIHLDLAIGNGYQLLSSDGYTLLSSDGYNLLSANGVSVSTAVTASDMVESSLKIAERIPVQAAFKLGFCKNWTVQNDLLTGIPQEHKDIFSNEWVSRTIVDSATATTYKLDNEPVQKDTLMIDETDTIVEANRLLVTYREPRTIFEFDAFANCIEKDLGEIISITHNRFGLLGSPVGIITKVQIDWMNFKVKIGVMI